MEIKLKLHGRYNKNIKITIDNPDHVAAEKLEAGQADNLASQYRSIFLRADRSERAAANEKLSSMLTVTSDLTIEVLNDNR
ncbi:hypothetical protein ACTXT7_008554 [Hymenolepis weldensis]